MVAELKDTLPDDMAQMVERLHVESNLQILDGSDNESKRNFRWPDMP